MTVTPAHVLVDQSFITRITGLSPGQEVTVDCQYVDALDTVRRSHATFRATAHGTVDLATQAPLSGTYSGVDSMGLIWSVLSSATENDLLGSTLVGFSHANTVTLTVEAHGHVIARATVTRYLFTPAVSHYFLQKEGLYGKFYWPTGKVRVPGVLVVGGSEGGLHPVVLREAALLAAHGYAALALAYFGEGKLPAQLVRIPLEYFMHALTWMQQQKQVDPGRLAIMGTSRGGELALLLAAHDPRLKAAISYVGSGLVIQSPDGNTPAWTYHGKPIPRLRTPETRAAIDAAAIPVQQINGPMLLIGAKDDQEWPSSRLLQFALQWAQIHHHHFADQLLSYAGAGHYIEPPYLATNAFVNPQQGGDAKDQEHADADSWLHILRLLAARLGT
jgi:dienelactone hydrolase